MRHKVLIVDDHLDSREVLKMSLEALGLEVETFETGAEGLDHLEQADGDVGVIILDLSMPTLDGLTVAEQIRKNEKLHSGRKPVKIIFFTARQIDPAVLRVAKRCNVSAVLQKGEDINALPSKVKALIEEDDT